MSHTTCCYRSLTHMRCVCAATHVFVRTAGFPTLVVVSTVGTHTDEELYHLLQHLDKLDMSLFNNSTIQQFLPQLPAKGTLHDELYLQAKLKELLRDLTFLDTYENSVIFM
ncbi:unnamed protein product [Ostreobium quekettii]|uniref:Uncharacterized protein n=1 Tax=Ostreobium quekettii TaxID=121088 RepID=A0A8S1IQ28_9CHLO|nr:unnamed protein product [Ostreobium quekettii]|eukprot:evm.model.scf_74.4 EVM.evm.TU.scf_74.4   scf_74:22633-23220(-)